MKGSPPFKKIPDSGREDLFDDFMEFRSRPLPEICPPFLSDSPSGLQKVSCVKSESESTEAGRPQGMIRNRMKELHILHPAIPQAPSHSRTMEDFPRKIFEGRIHLASELLRLFVSESVVKEPGGHPTGRIVGRLPPGLGPISQKTRYPSHMIHPVLSRFHPSRKGPMSGVHDERV